MTAHGVKSALDHYGYFTEQYGAKFGPAVACLTKDAEALPAFYDFPAGHRDHLRTSNPVESVFPPSAIAPSAPGAPCRKRP